MDYVKSAMKVSSQRTLGFGLRLKLSFNHQSGEGFSRSITSDSLSRLEDNEHTGFSEDIIREVAGMMFDGESFFKNSPVPAFLTGGYRWSRNSTLDARPRLPITFLTPVLDKVDLASVLLDDGSQPRRHEESSGGT